MFRLLVITLSLVCVSWVNSSDLPKPLPDGRIVGGFETDISKVPFQISLQSRGRHICGGSLISKRWVLTAAHCTSGQSASSLAVRIGSSRHASGGVVVNVQKIHQHTSYNSRNTDFDYSLLQLNDWNSNGVQFGVASLPSQGQDIPDGTSLRVSGWGDTKSAQQSNSVLRAVDVPKVNQQQCSNMYKSHGGVTDRMICAGFTQGGKDACQGDSGGPLVQGRTLVGVVSWGYGCAVPNYPGVYSRVSFVRNWIKQVSGV